MRNRIGLRRRRLSSVGSISSAWILGRAIHRLFGFKFWAFVVGAAPLEAELEESLSEQISSLVLRARRHRWVVLTGVLLGGAAAFVHTMHEPQLYSAIIDELNRRLAKTA